MYDPCFLYSLDPIEKVSFVSSHLLHIQSRLEKRLTSTVARVYDDRRQIIYSCAKQLITITTATAVASRPRLQFLLSLESMSSPSNLKPPATGNRFVLCPWPRHPRRYKKENQRTTIQSKQIENKNVMKHIGMPT